tara:strand:+ start:1427 stop:3160 length:1734 start_codon:yes stop_codon:yes gene_type:complete
MSVLEKLTEGLVDRNLSKEGAAMINKWEKTGLLEGMNTRGRETMSRLLENQAKELLREAASTMSGGDAEGFAAVAFPIVRRVFGSLIANDLVSVQPMSLPSGLIFFLDFTYDGTKLSNEANESIYGGGKVGKGIIDGVSLSNDSAEDSFYNLSNGYSSPTGSATTTAATWISMVSGTALMNDGADWGFNHLGAHGLANDYIASHERLLRWDPDLSGSNCVVATVAKTVITASSGFALNTDNLVGITVTLGDAGAQARRLTREDPFNSSNYLVVVYATGSETQAQLSASLGSATAVAFPAIDAFIDGGADVGSVVGSTAWGLENSETIPEIDIKVDSVSVTAITKKLKAKWTPELGQDLNAYHNLDAEVELTSVLSEHIALEIDREILEDLLKGANAATYHWSRKPGKFVNRTTGDSTNESLYPDFTGTVSEWYETLVETINDVSAQIHRKTLRGGANFLVMGPEVANVLEFTSGFRASITGDEDKGTVGAVKAGSISKKWDVWVDPYFPRNAILVGRKGGSFLESGYVYAPYVPLQVTPTIFGTEDFVPRKGVMTRYAKKMVRPDMYGVVVVEDLLG